MYGYVVSKLQSVSFPSFYDKQNWIQHLKFNTNLRGYNDKGRNTQVRKDYFENVLSSQFNVTIL